MWKEFKEFAVKGNVLDLAVGIVIGAAFGKIVNSLVNDVLMPPIGLAVKHVDFKDLFVNLSPTAYGSLAEAKAHNAPTLNYGMFLNTILEFAIVAFAVFMLVRAINRVRSGASGSSDHAGLPVLPHRHSTRCGSMSTLHFRFEGRSDKSRLAAKGEESQGRISHGLNFDLPVVLLMVYSPSFT